MHLKTCKTCKKLIKSSGIMIADTSIEKSGNAIYPQMFLRITNKAYFHKKCVVITNLRRL